MGNVNNQQLIVSGSVLHLARKDPTTGIVGPARDLGTIQVVNPTINSQAAQLFDSRGGRRQLVDTKITEVSETAEVTCSNMSLELLAFIFGSQTVSTYTQAGTALTNVAHTLYADSVLHLHDNSGNYLYDIASIQSIGTLTAGVDFITDPNHLKMGYVNIASNAAGLNADTSNSVNVSFTPNAISGKRYFNPHSAGTITCEAWLYWTADDYGTLQLRDTMTVVISPSGIEYKDSDYSDAKITISVLTNLTNSVQPAGRFIQPVGALPNRTI